MIAVSHRFAPRRSAAQRNAPLGSLEPLGRLRDAEGYQRRIAAPRRYAAQRTAPPRIAVHCLASLRSAPLRITPQRHATLA